MRVGSNPEKFNNQILNRAYHRIIIPVYIPHFEGYFKDAFEIFRYNIKSLLLTVHEKTRITIYNNNSVPEIKDYIDHLYQENPLIDQVFHSKENLGKINAILAGVKGNLEPLITITDSDVLFKHDWQKNVESIFSQYSEAGMVSPVPNSKAYKAFSANNWFKGAFGKAKIRFEKVQDPNEMKRFESSLGDNVKLYSPVHLEKYLTLSCNGAKAVMGAGHFVATLKREIFDKGSSVPAFIKIQGNVENRFIDIPNEKLGYLRLSTLNNYAFHLGNVSEEWMNDEFLKLKSRKPNEAVENFELSSCPLPKNSLKTLLGKVVRKVLLSDSLRERYFKSIGLKDGEKY